MGNELESIMLHEDLSRVGIVMHNFLKPVYKYTSVSNAKLILSNNTVRFSTPAAFNDPFEFNLDLFDTALSKDELNEMFVDKFKDFPGLDPQQKEAVKNTSVDDFKISYSKTLSEQRRKSLVFCSSEINDNILMWSHYANCHKGVCLGLLISPIYPAIEALTFKVSYTDSIQPARFYTNNQNQSVFALTQWAFTKASLWGYEQEVRTFIVNEGDRMNIGSSTHQNIKIDKSIIKEIYFGCETCANDINEIQTLLQKGNYKIDVKQMKKVKGKFALQPVAL